MCSHAQSSHADLPAPAALAAAHEHRAAARIEVALAERERFVDAQPGAPQHDNERPQAVGVDAGAGVAHDGDDLGDGRRVGGVALALVARQAPGVVARQRRWGARAAGGIEQGLGHKASLRIESLEAAAAERQDSPLARHGRQYSVGASVRRDPA
jgi:hypothetical protein